MKNLLHDIFVTYWSQFTLIGAVVGFFIQKSLNLKSKKTEISFSFFQQKRLDAVNRFFQNYSVVESMWHQLPIWDIFERKIAGKQIDDKIWPFLNQLQSSIHELKIYFPKDQYSYFQEVYDNCLKINGVLSTNLHDSDPAKNPVHKANDYEFKRVEILKMNQILIAKISRIVQLSFGLKN